MTYLNQLPSRHALVRTINPNAHVSGTEAGDVSPAIYGSSSMYTVNIINSVWATENGSDKITIAKSDAGVTATRPATGSKSESVSFIVS